MTATPFRLQGHRVRVHAGKDALDALPTVLRAAGASRAFVYCGRSVAEGTALIDRIRDTLGPACGAVFARAPRHGELATILEAVAQMRGAGCDGIVAVGAGSVLTGARLVAILAAEDRPPAELATQYPPGGRPVSPKLERPKPAIVNVPTAPSTAQNRGGAAALDGARRLEYFDPKTRPAAILWDHDALLTAPASLVASNARGMLIWTWLLQGGAARDNPIANGDAVLALRLARAAWPRLADPLDPSPRVDLCAAALLQNRYEDDGGQPFDGHWIERICYALGGNLFIRDTRLATADVYAALVVPAIRRFGDRCLPALAAMCAAVSPEAAARPPQTVAEVEPYAVAYLHTLLPRVPRLRDLGIAQDILPQVAMAATTNFNADRTGRLGEDLGLLEAVLRDAY